MRLPPSTIVLTAFVLFGYNAASAALPQQPTAVAADTGWSIEKPLTGGAIPCDSGRIKSFECQNVELLAYLPSSTIGGAAGYDLWGWTDSTTGREFAIIGGSSGTAFVEVTDPVNPKYLGILPPHAGVTTGGAQSVKVYKHHAFVTFEGTDHGLQVFDLTQLREVKTPPMVFQETAHYDNFANAHTLAMNEETGFAYADATTHGRETCGGGLHMIDVRTPTKPTFAGCHNNPSVGRGLVHDTQCVIYHGPDAHYKGREICINSCEAAVEIVDVTDKQQPKTISTFTYPNVGYTHQGWLTGDQRYFFLDDEGDESAMAQQLGPDKARTRTIGFDMSDLDDPVVLTEFYNPTTSSTDHNLYIRGRYMYEANYTAGLRIIDIADPKKPQEAGYLSNAGSAWTNYPYFKNDVVAVSMNTGLFLVKLRSR